MGKWLFDTVRSYLYTPIMPLRTAVVVISAFLLTASPGPASSHVGDEIAVSAAIAGPTHTVGFRLAGAFDGTQYVVVWEDVRSMGREIYAARVTPAGDVLDPLGIPVGVAGVNLVGPKVLWTGSRHLVMASSDDRSEKSTAYLMSLAPDGSILHAPRRIGDQHGRGLDMVMIADRVLTIRARETEVFVDLLDTTGEVLEAEVTHLPAEFHNTRAAASATRVLAVSATQSGVVGVLLGADGKLVSPATLRISDGLPNLTALAVASNGRDFIVVWQEGTHLMARRISRDGGLSESFQIGEVSLDYNRLTIVRAGKRYVVTSDNLHRLNLIDLYDDGRIVEHAVVPRPVLGTTTMVPVDDDVLGLWYREDESETRSVFAQKIGASHPEILISGAGARQLNPDIRAVPEGFEAIWIESRNPEQTALRAAAIIEGQPSAPREVVTSDEGQNFSDGSVRASGRAELAVWRERARVDYRDEYAIRARLIVDAIRDDFELASFDPGNAAPVVTAGDDAFLVTWFRPTMLKASLIGADATRADIQIDLPPRPYWGQQEVTGPRAAWSGERFLVVWSVEARRDKAFNSTVFGAFVERSGEISEVFELAAGTHAAVAWSGSAFLVAWTATDTIAGEHLEIHATRISPAGEPVWQNLILQDIARVSEPELVWTGRDYFLTWLDGHYRTRRLRGARISAGGRFFGDLELSGHTTDVRSHALARVAESRVAVAYSRPAAEAGGVPRLFVRSIDLASPPARRRGVRR